jgi:hypothetical protein
MEDVRLGRLTAVAETNVAVGAASAQIVAASPTRTVLIFSPPVAGSVTLSTIGPVVLNTGFQLNAGGLPLMLNVEDHGTFVSQAWFGIASAPTSIQVGQGLLAQL